MSIANKNINDLRSEISQISKEKHNKNKRKLKCFWTYPFGHFWGDHIGGSSYHRTCLLCGKNSCKGQNDGEWMRDVSCYAKRSKQFIKWIIGLKRKMRKIKPHRPIVIHGEPLTD